jgi:hypothetical protein
MEGRLRSVEVVVRSNIHAEQISELVTRVGGLHGCRTCGLVGIDLRLVGSDPAELEEHGLAEVPGVLSVVISEG